MKILKLFISVFVYGCLATIISEAALLSVLYAKGRLTNENVVQLLAVSQDVDLDSIREELEAKARPVEWEQVSFDEVLVARQLVSLDLDLQEIAADKGLIDVRQLDFLLDQERKQYDELKQGFDDRLKQLRQGAVDESLQEVQRQLESVDAKLAKDQILRLLDDPAFDPQTSMQFVVTMFKSMPLEKRKKIVAEFKDKKETERLHDILRQIRLGVPDVDVIRQTRQRLEAFNTRL